MADPIDDVEFLTRSENRVALIEALREGPASKPALQERLGMDRVTLSRILGEFEDRCWATGDDEWSLTVVGRLVADEFGEFRACMRSTRALRPLIGIAPIEDPDFPSDRLHAATITSAADGDPYAPIRRFMELLQDSDSLSGYDTTTIAPMYVDEIREEILDGMATAVIYRPSVVEQILDDYREDAAAAIESGHLTLWVADDLPCGLAIFDDRVAIGAYDNETGMLDVLVDTDDEAIREWARDSFETNLQSAVHLSDWLDEPLP